MKPIYIKVNKNKPLMVIPDADGHMDGHPVLTYTYALYDYNGNDPSPDMDTLLSPDRKDRPDYMGTLTFEQPGKLFSYAADGQQKLSSGELEEAIEQITHYRENPNLWVI